MGQKKDIGKLFATRLSEGKQIPKESLWEKINTSLDEEKRKRKRLLIYWWLGGGISVLVGLFLLFGAGNFLNQNSETPSENNYLEQNSFSNSEKENTETTINISEKDSLQFKDNAEEKLSKIENINESKTLNNPETLSKKTSEKKIQKGSSKGKSIDETYTVSKKYYYYNSKDGKQMVTSNKDEIDSLVSQQYKSLDTTATKKIESPEE
jgi:hypothetical protein